MNIHTIGSDLADLATKVEACRDSLVGHRKFLLDVINSALIQNEKQKNGLDTLLDLTIKDFDEEYLDTKRSGIQEIGGTALAKAVAFVLNDEAILSYLRD